MPAFLLISGRIAYEDLTKMADGVEGATFQSHPNGSVAQRCPGWTPRPAPGGGWFNPTATVLSSRDTRPTEMLKASGNCGLRIDDCELVIAD